MQSFISGSKAVSVLNGKVTSSTGYKSYITWLELTSSNKLVCRINGVIIFSDNTGKHVIKYYRVFRSNIKTADVVAVTLHFQIN